MTDLQRALDRFKTRPRTDDHAPSRASAAAFRASMIERLRGMERDVAELKGRVNGLIFVVVGAVVTQVVMKVAG